MSFTTPAALLLLAALPLVAWLVWPAGSRRSGRRPRPRSGWVGLVLRLLILALLVLSLAGAQLARAVDDLAVVFLVDGSDSMSRESAAAAEAFVREAVGRDGAGRPRRDRPLRGQRPGRAAVAPLRLGRRPAPLRLAARPPPHRSGRGAAAEPGPAAGRRRPARRRAERRRGDDGRHGRGRPAGRRVGRIGRHRLPAAPGRPQRGHRPQRGRPGARRPGGDVPAGDRRREHDGHPGHVARAGRRRGGLRRGRATPAGGQQLRRPAGGRRARVRALSRPAFAAGGGRYLPAEQRTGRLHRDHRAAAGAHRRRRPDRQRAR
jgi:hypothetical protein